MIVHASFKFTKKIDVIQYKIKKQYFNVISLFMKKMKSL